MKVLAMPPPTTSWSTLSASDCRMDSWSRGGLGAVRGAEGVVDVHIAQRRHLARQAFVVLFLAHVAAAVLQQHDFARLDGNAVDPVGHQAHLHAQQFGQALRDRGQRVRLGQRALLGAAQVRGDHDRRAGV
ncbi:Uncharacterised protein [Bordetella pertussis]|nr:Uncharacterised protein [Bordetella pertussis]